MTGIRRCVLSWVVAGAAILAAGAPMPATQPSTQPATGPTGEPSLPPAMKHGAWVMPDDRDLSAPERRKAVNDARVARRATLAIASRPASLQKCFVETKAFLYDRRLYDPATGQWRIDEFLDQGVKDVGGYDQVILWQSYPRLGLDERNQFDYCRDLPGGVEALAQWVKVCRARGVRTLVTYNPWDLNTRQPESHLAALVDLLKATGADGVYLDTMSAVPAGWAEAMKALPRPITFESEGSPQGVAINDMHGCWGQGYTITPPCQIFNLRWLSPTSKIFLTNDRHNRDHWDEVRCGFFSGTGVLVWENVFGNDTSWVPRDQALLRSLAPIQRAFWQNFAADDWQPLVAAADKSLRVNRWPGPLGTVYTLGLTGTAGYSGGLIAAQVGKRYLDLIGGGELAIRAGAVVGDISATGVGAILEVDQITDEVLATVKRVAPGKLPAFEVCNTARLKAPTKPAQTPRLGKYKGAKPDALPDGMVWVPGGKFTMKLDHPFQGARCYDHSWGKEGKAFTVEGFAMDRFPVTNAQFARFLAASNYKPKDAHNFLRHWTDGKVPAGLEDHPVVNVALEDARAYAAWAGKRLPTEVEWQFAASGTDGLAWPWGKDLDPKKCNPGGKTSAVGAFEGDASPAGVRDLVGNVWQWVDDVYEDKVHVFGLVKGGSYFRVPADASKWYIHTGPCPTTSHAKVPLLAASLDRFSTVGFRCVVD